MLKSLIRICELLEKMIVRRIAKTTDEQNEKTKYHTTEKIERTTTAVGFHSRFIGSSECCGKAERVK